MKEDIWCPRPSSSYFIEDIERSLRLKREWEEFKRITAKSSKVIYWNLNNEALRR